MHQTSFPLCRSDYQHSKMTQKMPPTNTKTTAASSSCRDIKQKTNFLSHWGLKITHWQPWPASNRKSAICVSNALYKINVYVDAVCGIHLKITQDTDETLLINTCHCNWRHGFRCKPKQWSCIVSVLPIKMHWQENYVAANKGPHSLNTLSQF